MTKKSFEVRTGVAGASQGPNAGAERKRLDEATMLSSIEDIEVVLKKDRSVSEKISDTPK